MADFPNLQGNLEPVILAEFCKQEAKKILGEWDKIITGEENENRYLFQFYGRFWVSSTFKRNKGFHFVRPTNPYKNLNSVKHNILLVKLWLMIIVMIPGPLKLLLMLVDNY